MYIWENFLSVPVHCCFCILGDQRRKIANKVVNVVVPAFITRIPLVMCISSTYEIVKEERTLKDVYEVKFLFMFLCALAM